MHGNHLHARLSHGLARFLVLGFIQPRIGGVWNLSSPVPPPSYDDLHDHLLNNPHETDSNLTQSASDDVRLAPVPRCDVLHPVGQLFASWARRGFAT